MREPVHYIPILTTFVALAFAADLFRRHHQRGGLHLLWWAVGMLTYAGGTATEAYVTLFGWNAPAFRLWYVFGALLGGAPLAQGSVYLHLSRRTANRLTIALVAVVAFGAVAVALTPIDTGLVESHRLSGQVMTWRWVRYISPFVNLYAVVFLIGGALRSALRFARSHESRHRAIGNALITVGAILPGIGGGFTRFGHVEVLYVTEFIGLLLIFAGYRLATRERASGSSTSSFAPNALPAS
jgi:hypothetical protein